MGRIEKFQFAVVHRKGAKMPQSDALSRAVAGAVTTTPSDNLDEEILKVHEEFAHRKEIKPLLHAQGIQAAEKQVRAAISRCNDCIGYEYISRQA